MYRPQNKTGRQVQYLLERSPHSPRTDLQTLSLTSDGSTCSYSFDRQTVMATHVGSGDIGAESNESTGHPLIQRRLNLPWPNRRVPKKPWHESAKQNVYHSEGRYQRAHTCTCPELTLDCVNQPHERPRTHRHAWDSTRMTGYCMVW